MLQIEFTGYLLAALCLIFLPLRWVMGLVFAVSLHELSHVAAISAFRVKIQTIRLSGRGVVIHTEPMSDTAEAVCALAGPLGSFMILLIACQFPEAALIALGQGLFNLLPIYPLDGGRFVRCVAPYALCRAVEVFTWILLLGAGLWLYISENLGICAFLPAAVTGMLLIHGKFPCKDGKLTVQ